MFAVKRPTQRMSGAPDRPVAACRPLARDLPYSRAGFDDLDHTLLSEHACVTPRLCLIGRRERTRIGGGEPLPPRTPAPHADRTGAANGKLTAVMLHNDGDGLRQRAPKGGDQSRKDQAVDVNDIRLGADHRIDERSGRIARRHPGRLIVFDELVGDAVTDHLRIAGKTLHGRDARAGACDRRAPIREGGVAIEQRVRSPQLGIVDGVDLDDAEHVNRPYFLAIAQPIPGLVRLNSRLEARP